MNAPGAAGEGGTGEIPPDAARNLRIVFLDVDGVLTDGGVWWTDPVAGEPLGLRRFDVRDGLGLFLLRNVGFHLAVISGKQSPAVRARARELGIDEVHQVPAQEKVGVARQVLDRHGLDWRQAACLGDDLPDLALLRQVGLPVAVGDAVPEVADAARWRARSPGGEGAVREFAEALLRARGEWDETVSAYVERGEEM